MSYTASAVLILLLCLVNVFGFRLYRWLERRERQSR